MTFCVTRYADAIVITIPVSPGDPLRTVRLRNLNINGIRKLPMRHERYS